jgi:cell division protein FtsW
VSVMRGRETARPVKASRKPPAPPLEYSLLLTATLCLLAFGAVMVFSASSARSLLNNGGSGFYYLERTVAFAAIGLVAMRLLAVRGVAAVRVLTPLLLGVSLFLLFAVLVPGVGQQVNGSQRWIGAGLLQFQPSELAKLALVLYGAFLLAKEPKRAKTLSGLGPYLLVVGLALILIAKEPDLGTAIVASVAVCCVLFLGGVRARTLAPVGIAIAVIGIGMIATHPYQEARLTGFLHPSSDTSGAGFQAKQATIAVGSGGISGVGLGESVQKASYLPEAHTDMVAAVIGEELGFVGMLVLIGLFGMFGYAGLRAAHRARDRFSKLVAAGLTSLIMAQAALNLFAVLGLAPLTGVPLPFVSYGGTSLVLTLASAGLILNVARRPAAGTSARRTSGSSRGGRRAAGGPARLRVVEGGDARVLRAERGATRQTKRNTRRKRAASGTSRDSGRRHGGARRAGDRRRRRASR